ncbi:hypothetical protein JOB18_000643 [Solea senegalensis]|uniref:Uncharacterized protein n=1 Tax=Solea senegalensis TaxID=28829 RepID=A0AAV6R9Y4_SOLSE|nr:uncharacterized protein si:dkeyp-34c12.1 [Solea senegalensis]KAG7501489.1 hypothetical protein JOB18_000643 [Solea senegalensis]
MKHTNSRALMFGITSQQRLSLMDVTKRLDFSGEDLSLDHEPNMEAVPKEKKDTDKRRTFDLDATETKTEPACTDSMLKGMKGYEPTPADLEFINKMKEEKLLKHMQEELLEVQRLLKREEMALELACASRDKVKAELNKFPSCEELSEWIMVVLKITRPLLDLTDLDTKDLLALVTEEDVQTAMDETRYQIKQKERILTNRRKNEAKGNGRLEKVIATEQLKIQKMMTQLSDLTSELARQEEIYKALQTQIETSKGNKVEAKVEDTSEVKSEGKQQRKPRKKTKEKLPDAKNERKSNRSKRADVKTENQAVKDDTNETPLTTPSTTVQTKSRSLKAAKGPQRKVQEQEAKSQESVQAVRGRPKPAETKVKSVDVQSSKPLQAAPSRRRGKAAVAAAAPPPPPRDDGEEAQSAGLRRSKRIANKRSGL